MARNAKRDRVGGASRRHGAGAVRLAETPGKCRVGDGGAARDGAQHVPHTLLERRAVAHVERQVETDAGRFDEARYRGEIVVQGSLVLDQHPVGETVGEVQLQRVGVGADQDGADADMAAGRQDFADLGFADRIGNGVEGGSVGGSRLPTGLHEVHCLHSFVCA